MLLGPTRSNYGVCCAAGKAIFGTLRLNRRAAGCTGLNQRHGLAGPTVHIYTLFTLICGLA